MISTFPYVLNLTSFSTLLQFQESFPLYWFSQLSGGGGWNGLFASSVKKLSKSVKITTNIITFWKLFDQIWLIYCLNLASPGNKRQAFTKRNDCLRWGLLSNHFSTIGNITLWLRSLFFKIALYVYSRQQTATTFQYLFAFYYICLTYMNKTNYIFFDLKTPPRSG